MKKNRYKFTIPNNERQHYLVVAPETHQIVKHYARKWGVTITAATQQLLSIAIKKTIQEEQSND